MKIRTPQHTQEARQVAEAPAVVGAPAGSEHAANQSPTGLRSASTAMKVGGPVALEADTPSEDLVKEFSPDLQEVGKSPLDLSDPEAAWEWVKANVADIDEDFESIAREHTEAYCRKYLEVQQKGVAEIHRVVVLPSIDQLDTARIGTHWSFERHGAGDYGLNRQRLPEDKTWLLTGRATPTDIDWEYGLYSFVWYGEDQWECSLKGGVEVPVIAVNGETLPCPLECRAYNLNSCGGKGSMHPDDDEIGRILRNG